MTDLGAGSRGDGAGAAGGRLPRALPPIKEKWLPAYRGLWWAAFLLALSMSLGGLYVRAVSSTGISSAFERTGLMVSEQQGGLRVLLTVGEEAAGSGIRRGDAIVAIGGRPVSDDPSAYEDLRERLDGPAGSRVQVTTRSPEGAVRTHTLTRTQQHLEQAYSKAGLTQTLMRAADFADVLTTALLLAAAALLFRRRPRDPVAALLSLGLLLNLTAAGSSEYLILQTGGDVFFNGLLSIGWVCMLLAILTFPDGRFEPRWTLPVALLFPLTPIIEPFDETAATMLDMVFFSVAVLAIALRYRHSRGDQRQQVRWALLGFAGGAFFMALDQALLFLYRNAPSMTVALWSELLHYLVYALIFICIPLGLLISLLRYRLYDADAAISRSAAFAMLTMLLSATFAGSMNGVEALIQASFGRDAGAEAAAVAAAFTAVMIAPAHNSLHRWAEGRFRKALIHLQRGLPEWLADVRETAGMSDLLDPMIERISIGVRARRAAVLLADGETWRVAATRSVDVDAVRGWAGDATIGGSGKALDRQREDALFPVRIGLHPPHAEGGAPIGWILLGPRPDGSFYGKDELEALAEIADPIARAVQIVRSRERQAREQTERLAKLEQAVRSALDAVAAIERKLSRS